MALLQTTTLPPSGTLDGYIDHSDEDDGPAHYDVSFIYQNYEYTYEIGMHNNQVLSIEKERLD